ncbi:hypothetical protein HanXRQr2_Chr12g0534581 [Helianthus annuus]|uniref:Uncharacterized protein n=1 Tax=Helianthus annuus TaxID=4232 RepID=A0A251TC91_HELAN|nr:hypothetical protein HanXRQr2_Chr12g0534581 [Helianthus annuus]KAJ0862161.1 hypothetical protein HanPSC8_Chr12g0514901 [Helianthus annuus]
MTSSPNDSNLTTTLIPFFIVFSTLQLQLHVIFTTQFFYPQHVCSLRSRVLPRRRICDDAVVVGMMRWRTVVVWWLRG